VPPRHIVIPDTSVLYSDDKTFLVNRSFNEFWESYGREYDFKLLVPVVVKGEILFRCFKSAYEASKRVKESLEKITRITGFKYYKSIDASKIKRQLNTKFNKWLRSLRGKLLPLPVDEIDWSAVVRKSIWREETFEAKNGNIKYEKGFRDCLILETVVNFCNSCNNNSEFTDMKTAFLVNDGVLRESAVSRLRSNPTFSVYDTIDNFRSYLDFTKEERSNEFIEYVINKANLRFFNLNDRNSIYYRYDVRGQLKTKFKTYFDDPKISETLTDLERAFGSSDAEWTYANKGRFIISSPNFDHIENKTFFWVSKVEFVRTYRMKLDQLVPVVEPPEIYKLLKLIFNVNWRVDINQGT